MRTKKNEIVYYAVLWFCIFLIYVSFKTAFANVSLNQIDSKTKVFFLSFENYIYLVVALALSVFSAYLYMHLGVYKVGKLLMLYLVTITACICLVSVASYKYTLGNIIVGMLALLSNVFLFYSIGYITLLTHRRFFKIFLAMLLVLTVIFIFFYVSSFYSDKISFTLLKNKIITIDYVLTIMITMFSMLMGYKHATIYSKHQIKFLTISLLMGITVFITMQVMPMLAVVKVPQTSKEVVVRVQYQMDLKNVGQDIYPVMIFTVMAVVMIYILIKREYLEIDEYHNLWQGMFGVGYLMVGNTYFLFVTSVEWRKYLLFNIILVMPLMLLNYRIWKKKERIYDTNLIEVLEEERQRISVLLHDEILQDLIALSHSIQEDDMKERLSAVIGEIRGISQDLYPTIVEDLGLEQALNIFIEDIRVDYNIDLKFQYDYPKGILPKAVALVLYRTVKELITNAIKHSHCRNILIQISDVAGNMECVVMDDGCGFQIPENIELLKSPHMGLYTVKKQIAGLNGNVKIFSDKSGSKFQICIPLKIGKKI